jgi:septal ring factor EnvC (AmiA/AmiB activator)
VFDLNYLLTGEGQLLTIKEDVKSEDIEKTINPTSSPQAIDYTFLIEKAVEKATAYADKTIAMMEKQISRLENDLDAKDQEIKRLQSRIQELETENIIFKNEENLGKYPFEMGVSDKKEQQQTHV